MATAPNPPSAPIQAQNSPRSRQSRRTAAARGITHSPPPPLSLADQEQFVSSSSAAMASDISSKEAVVSSAAATAEEGSGADENSDSGGGAMKKPVWNKPSNGAAAAEAVGAAVMGADSWPALSESARASPKSASTHSLKSLSQGSSVGVSQETLVGSVPSSTEVVTDILTPNSSSNHVNPSRQKSMKRIGGSSSHSNIQANDNLSQAPPIQSASVEPSTPNAGKSGGSLGESSRDNTYRDGGQRGGSYGGNEQQPQRNFRRNNSGPLTRGDGSYHQSHGARRDQERGKQDWASSPHNRSFGSRENHAPQQRFGSRPFSRGPAPNATFVPPPPSVAVRPFVPQMVYPEMSPPVFYAPGIYPDSFRPMPMVPISSMFLSMPDPYLSAKILNQIDYYFSNENLVKDTFLRQNMDGEGWVSIKLIAGFKKVMQLTDNIQLILDAIQASNVVEVQGDKVRRKGDWTKWIMPPFQATTVTSPQSISKSTQNMLAAHLNNVTLDEKAAT